MQMAQNVYKVTFRCCKPGTEIWMKFYSSTLWLLGFDTKTPLCRMPYGKTNKPTKQKFVATQDTKNFIATYK